MGRQLGRVNQDHAAVAVRNAGDFMDGSQAARQVRGPSHGHKQASAHLPSGEPVFQRVQIQHAIVARGNAERPVPAPRQVVGAVLEFGEHHRVAVFGTEVELPPQLVDRGRGVVGDAQQRVARVGVDEIDELLPGGGEDFG